MLVVVSLETPVNWPSDREGPDRNATAAMVLASHDGAAAFLTESELQAIRSLTPQQRKIFGCLAEGLANKEIALRYGIHESTVKAHVSAAFAKLGCSNRIKVALLAQRYALGREHESQQRDVR